MSFFPTILFPSPANLTIKKKVLDTIFIFRVSVIFEQNFCSSSKFCKILPFHHQCRLWIKLLSLTKIVTRLQKKFCLKNKNLVQNFALKINIWSKIYTNNEILIKNRNFVRNFRIENYTNPKNENCAQNLFFKCLNSRARENVFS